MPKPSKSTLRKPLVSVKNKIYKLLRRAKNSQRLTRSLTKRQIVLLSFVSLILASSAIWWLVQQQYSQKQPASAKGQELSQLEKQVKSGPPTPVEADFQFQYFDRAKEIKSLEFYKNTDYFGKSCEDGDKNCKLNIEKKDINYYQIGKSESNQRLIVAHANKYESGLTDVFLEIRPGEYLLLLRALDKYPFILEKENASYVREYEAMLTDNVELNASYTLRINFLQSATVSGQTIYAETYGEGPVYKYFLPHGIKSLHQTYEKPVGNYQKIGQDYAISYYRVVARDEKNYQVHQIFGTFHQLFGARYQYTSEVVAEQNQASDIDWVSGVQNNSEYFTGGPGCGTPDSYIVAKNVNEIDLMTAATLRSGTSIYELPSTHPLVREIYEEDYQNGKYIIANKKLKGLSLEAFLAQHPYFLIKNGFGQYVLMLRNDIVNTGGGCGKPVIYLYPEQTTTISVKVGADVSVSEPLYPSGGWQNVLAQPDGMLTYKSTEYPYLYWEGYGHGLYPDKSTQGVVVPSAKAAATIRAQLHAQGLHDNEITDFLEFWEPKLPITPYTRLTWLSKADLDLLAPLTVTPRPKVSIRVFLEFEGLHNKLPLQPQSFKAPVRTGFTLVEWGGLLRNFDPKSM